MKKAESARWAILAGWFVALLGVTCYVMATARAGEGTDILDALTGQGLIGWASISLVLGGVAIWLFGNVTLLREEGNASEMSGTP